jgi:RND family efflux transporter MFP subunit
MKNILRIPPPAAAVIAAAALLVVVVHAADDKKAASAAPKPALTVTTTTPQPTRLPLKISANGNIAAWQEASIGTEANGLRLAEVRVNVGDVVRRGQVLATFAPDMIQADLSQHRANVAEAEAMLADAAANAQRARELQPTGALSAQQINQYLTAERTARAKLDAMRASARAQQLRLAQTQVLAPDDGIISARSATVGAVMPAGMEMFRMIRKGKLEWRAEVPGPEMARLKPGMTAGVIAGGGTIIGKVRVVAPTVDDKTRNGIVYVDLPASPDARAGMFAHGDFEIGAVQGLTLPQSAVLLREGFNYVLRVGPDSKVSEAKVSVGRRVGDRVEITAGLTGDARVVASGGSFLGDGDLVKVVDAPPAVKTAATAPAVTAVK